MGQGSKRKAAQKVVGVTTKTVANATTTGVKHKKAHKQDAKQDAPAAEKIAGTRNRWDLNHEYGEQMWPPSAAELEKQRLAEKELAEKEVAEKELAEKELAEKELAEKELAEKEVAEKELAEKELAEKELAEKEVDKKRAEKARLAAEELAEKALVPTPGPLAAGSNRGDWGINFPYSEPRRDDQGDESPGGFNWYKLLTIAVVLLRLRTSSALFRTLLLVFLLLTATLVFNAGSDEVSSCLNSCSTLMLSMAACAHKCNAALDHLEQELYQNPDAIKRAEKARLAEQELAEQELAEKEVDKKRAEKARLAKKKLAEKELAEKEVAEKEVAEKEVDKKRAEKARLAEKEVAEKEVAEKELAKMELAGKKKFYDKLLKQASQKVHRDEKAAKHQAASQVMPAQAQSNVGNADGKTCKNKKANDGKGEQAFVDKFYDFFYLRKTAADEERIAAYHDQNTH
jgi:hypothetical protein